MAEEITRQAGNLGTSTDGQMELILEGPPGSLIEEFLQECRQELLSDKLEINEELDLIRTKTRENEKFIELLSKDETEEFSEFSPREMASKTNARISELRKTLREDLKRRDALVDKLSAVEERLQRVTGLLLDTDEIAAWNKKHPSKRVDFGGGSGDADGSAQAAKLLEVLAGTDDGSGADGVSDADAVGNAVSDGVSDDAGAVNAAFAALGTDDGSTDNEDLSEIAAAFGLNGTDGVADGAGSSQSAVGGDGIADLAMPTNVAAENAKTADDPQITGDEFYQEMLSLVTRCKRIDSYILSDPMRGKMELRQVAGELDEILRLL